MFSELFIYFIYSFSLRQATWKIISFIIVLLCTNFFVQSNFSNLLCILFYSILMHKPNKRLWFLKFIHADIYSFIFDRNLHQHQMLDSCHRLHQCRWWRCHLHHCYFSTIIATSTTDIIVTLFIEIALFTQLLGKSLANFLENVFIK